MDGSGCAEPNRHVVRSQHCGASIKSVLLCVWGGRRIVFFLRSFCHTDHFPHAKLPAAPFQNYRPFRPLTRHPRSKWLRRNPT